MSEVILRQDWLPQVEVAFEKLKLACTAERKEFCEVIGEDHGPEAEAELRAKLAAHDQAMAAKLKLIQDQEAETVPTEAPKAVRSFILPATQPRVDESPKHTEAEATVPVSAEVAGWGSRRGWGSVPDLSDLKKALNKKAEAPEPVEPV